MRIKHFNFNIDKIKNHSLNLDSIGDRKFYIIELIEYAYKLNEDSRPETDRESLYNEMTFKHKEVKKISNNLKKNLDSFLTYISIPENIKTILGNDNNLNIEVENTFPSNDYNKDLKYLYSDLTRDNYILFWEKHRKEILVKFNNVTKAFQRHLEDKTQKSLRTIEGYHAQVTNK